MFRKSSNTSLQKIFSQSQLLIFALTLGICSLIFVVISIYTMNTYAKQSLNIFSATLSEQIQPAVIFNDRITLQQTLNNHIQQYPIRAIQVINLQGKPLAEAYKPTPEFAWMENLFDKVFFKHPVTRTIKHQNNQYGSLIIYGSATQLMSFFFQLLICLSAGIFIILLIMLWLVHSTYQKLMHSIQPMVNTVESLNLDTQYQARLPSSPIYEFRVISGAFNNLLDKVQRTNEKLQSENSQLSHQALHDQLTELPNRHYFYNILFNQFEHPEKNQTALFFIDNNNFKNINDVYGHLAGDAVLKEMAQRLKKNVRSHDVVARLGGDEFAILLRNIKHYDHLELICEHLIEYSKAPLSFDQHQIHFSFSIGVAFSKCATTPEDLIAEADNAMYKAKNLAQGWYITPCLNPDQESSC